MRRPAAAGIHAVPPDRSDDRTAVECSGCRVRRPFTGTCRWLIGPVLPEAGIIATIEVFMSDSTQYTDEFKADAVTPVIERGFTMWRLVPHIAVHADA